MDKQASTTADALELLHLSQVVIRAALEELSFGLAIAAHSTYTKTSWSR